MDETARSNARNVIPTIEQRPGSNGRNEGATGDTGSGNAATNPRDERSGPSGQSTGEPSTRRPRRRIGEGDEAYRERTGREPSPQRATERSKAAGIAQAAVEGWNEADIAGISNMFAEVWYVFGYLMAHQRGEHWQFTKADCQVLGTRTANIVKHMPTPPKEAGLMVDISLLGVAVMGTVGPKLQRDMQIAQEKIDTEKRQTVQSVDDWARERFGAQAKMGQDTPPPPPETKPQ